MEEDKTIDEWLASIPTDVRRLIDEKPVLEAGFAAGPSFVAGRHESFAPPISLTEALRWLFRFRHMLRGAHVWFDDESGLWLDRHGFTRYDDQPASPPRPGVVVPHDHGSDSD